MIDAQDPGNDWAQKPLSLRLRQIKNQWLNLGERQQWMLEKLIMSAEYLEHKVSALPETSQDVHDTLIDAERYRWFRDECDKARRIDIAELSERPDLLDHQIDKGRVGL